MALSGTFYGSTNNEYIQPKIVWSATQSVSGNYSTVTASLYYSRTNTGYTTTGTGDFVLNINGNSKSVEKKVEITHNSNTLAVTHSVTVYHNSDGTKSITIRGFGGISGTSFSSTTISATVTLDSIGRATTPSLSTSSVDMGGSITINMPRASSSFTHDLAYAFAGSGYTSFATDRGVSYTWTVPDLASKIPDASSGSVSVRCQTYNGSTLVGTKYVSFTAKVPASVVPTVGTVTTADAETNLASRFGAFIQGKSRIKTTIAASGAKGSTIKSYSTTFNGATYTGSSWTSGVVNSSGNVSMTITVTDSRGRKGKKTVTVSVLAYSPPQIALLSATRVNAAGTVKEDGEYILLGYDYAVSSLGGKNTAAMVIDYKLATASTYPDGNVILTGTALSAEEQKSLESPTFSADYQFDVRMVVTDWFGTSSTYTVRLGSGAVILDLLANGLGIAFGKTADQPGVDMGWSAKGAVFGLWEATAQVPENGDLNDFVIPGVYTTFSNARLETVKNCPSKYAGTMRVYAALGTTRLTGAYVYVIQEYRSYWVSEPTYRRLVSTGADGTWTAGAWVADSTASYGLATTT